ncbi:MAG: hypothetical protein LDLANPLL_02351 [Turneriella sp.]|nr:hypothetical protein [Turneriella sp.]
MWKKYGVLALTLLALQCNNYGLVDKLENPSTEVFTDKLYIFVSSWTTAGDMSGQPFPGCSSLIGLSKADCACTRAAATGNLRKSRSHEYRAYLGIASGGSAIDPRCRVLGLGSGCITVTGPWYNTLGELVANDSSAFTGSPLSKAIKYTEMRGDFSPDLVWTGAGASGNHVSGCPGWNDNSVGSSANVGDRNATNSTWQSISTPTCNTTQRIYCMAVP